MATCFEYGVTLTDNQKRSLASAMNNRTPLTLRIKIPIFQEMMN